LVLQLQERSAALAGGEGAQLEIATIFFGYKNGELIRTLKERGQIIFDEKVNKIEKIEFKINKLIEKKHDEFITPVSAFVTFNT